jgi:hypothetical protein
MDITSQINELNDAKASLAISLKGTPERWAYIGDMAISEGGTAVKVDQLFRSHADIVEGIDLGSAIGQSGCLLIERGNVMLDSWSYRRRKILKSALDSFGLTASKLLQFTRDERAVQIAHALWVYGARDTEQEIVIRHDGATGDDIEYPRGGGYMEPESEVDGEQGLIAAFMEHLD